MTKKQTIFSAIQPSGESHIGNYLGALKNFVELQDEYDCYFFIADYHSISGEYNPAEKKKQIMNLALDFLAIGLNPQKCTIAVQSQVPEHTELAWIFNTITPLVELQRMTQFKDKSQQQDKNINMGLLDYPVLQAADILMYKTYGVPVGQDQIQHVELTRKIARFFNNKF
ncbi:MAG: tryptophan--tRNA ligase, partial [Candidatus Pacebacteria bacterium]|nr:tryptophan--tRNA ligase [Candidatus Paceibacterota bacterium]